MKKTFLLFSIFLFHSVFLSSQESEVRLLFLGDIMGHGPQINAAYNSKTKTYDYNDSFKYIRDILSEPDFTIANLEVTLGTKPYSGYPMFSSPPELAVAIKNAGIDLLGTANNHSVDRGKKGIEKTIEILDSLDIPHFGTYVNQEQKTKSGLTILEKKGMRIGLLNYTYGTNGIPVPTPTIVNQLDKDLILEDIEWAKKYSADVLIAYVHWGSEYKDLATSEQKNWNEFFNENGISIVIGSHPHVVEPMEWNQKDKSIVVYSLGNFVSNQRFFPSDGGALFELTLTKNHKNEVIIAQAEYILIWVYKKMLKEKAAYYILPVDEFQYKKYFFSKKLDFDQMMKFTNHVRKLLEANNQNVPEKKIFTKNVQLLMRENYLLKK